MNLPKKVRQMSVIGCPPRDSVAKRYLAEAPWPQTAFELKKRTLSLDSAAIHHG
jgi:hypothetical protein